MKLYTHPETRGSFIEWYVNELKAQGKGSDIEVVHINYAGKEHRQPEYLKINPFGRVPAFEDVDLKLFETSVIAMYIGEKCGAKGLDTPEGRAATNRWAVFGCTTLVESLFFLEKMNGEAGTSMKHFQLSQLDQVLEGKSFLENGELGPADVCVGGWLYFCRDCMKMDCFKEYRNINRYIDELAARPAQTLKFK